MEVLKFTSFLIPSYQIYFSILGIVLPELSKWLKGKACEENGGPWKLFLSHEEIINIAHTQASKSKSASMGIISNRVVDIGEFRNLLLHLFVISVLWVHFEKADKSHMSQDRFNERLALPEFTMAIKTFSAVYGQEELTPEVIEKDFRLLDHQHNDSVSFSEVCDFCCRFVDDAFAEDIKNLDTLEIHNLEGISHSAKTSSTKVKRLIQNSKDTILDEENKRLAVVINELNNKPTSQEISHGHLDIQSAGNSDHLDAAMDTFALEIEKNKHIADFVEMKVAMEELIGGSA